MQNSRRPTSTPATVTRGLWSWDAISLCRGWARRPCGERGKRRRRTGAERSPPAGPGSNRSGRPRLEEEEAQTQRHGRSREIAGQSQQHQQLVSGEGRIFEAEQQQKIQYQAEHQQPPPPADGPGQQVVNHGQRRHQAQVPGRPPGSPSRKRPSCPLRAKAFFPVREAGNITGRNRAKRQTKIQYLLKLMGSGLSLDGFTVMTVQPASRFPSKKENFSAVKRCGSGAQCIPLRCVRWSDGCIGPGDAAIRKTKNNSILRCFSFGGGKVDSNHRKHC